MNLNWLVDILIQALNFFYSITGSYGWSIILLTTVINIALYPLTLSSVVQMAAVQRVQPKIAEIQKKYKDVPWNRMIGLRNIVIHGYFGIDLSIIWEIITKNLPEIKPVLLKILKEID